jgi:galactonate dehydratase
LHARHSPWWTAGKGIDKRVMPVKIASVDSVVVNAKMRNWIFVRVRTNEGLVGWGEATLEWKTRGVIGAIEDVSRFILGEDPMRIEHLFEIMRRQYFWRPGIEGMSAISGIEQALWDIKGKALGVPVYELLGGRVRDRIRLYTHLGGGFMSTMYETVEPARFAESALEVKERGYTALKFMPVPRMEAVEGMRSVAYAEGVVSAVREAVGDDMDLMVDLHGRSWPAMAIQFCRAFEPYGLLFLEEPCPPDDIDATAQVKATSSIPIATGERLIGRHQFLDLLERQACHVIQPDISHAGGLWETYKIAILASAHSVAVAPHNPIGPVATAVALHFAAATSNWLIQETVVDDVPWRAEIIDLPVAVTDGYADIPSLPGLGMEVNEREASKHPFAPEAEQRYFHADGSVADW